MARGLFALGAVAALAAGTLLGASARPALADGFSDAFIGYRYGSNYREPANPSSISKNIIQFQYVNGNKYGGNFLNADVLISDGKDPAASGGGGAQEIYLVYRHEFSLGGLTGHPWAFGPVRNVGITAGADLNSKNDPFAARVRKVVLGPTFEFKVKGYANLTVGAIWENNHNGIVNNLNITNPPPIVAGAPLKPPIPGTTNVVFSPAYRIEAAWGLPIKLGVPAKIQGFANYTGPRARMVSVRRPRPSC
jgi:nucleoside-specific outer membrane channel protein Tsx